MKKSESQCFNNILLSNHFHKICQLFKADMFSYVCMLILLLISTYLFIYDLKKYAMLSFFVFFAFLLSLTIDKFHNNSEYIISQKYTHLFLIIFISSFSFSIIYLQFGSPLYTKPLLYYLCIGVCSSSIFLISYSMNTKQATILMPILLALLSLNVFLSNYITFPNGVYASGDSHYQIYNIVLPIIENGNIPQGQTYSSFPLHQIYVVLTSMISNIEPVKLYLYYPSIIYTLLGLFVFSFAKHIFHDLRISTVCILIYIASPEVVYHATHAYQFSYAAPIGIMLLFLAMLLYFPINDKTLKSKTNYIFLFILLICALVWMHQFTSAVVFALFILLCCTSLFVFKNVKISSYKIIILLFITTMFAQWIHVSNTFSSLFHVFSTYYSSLTTPENYQAALSISETGGIYEPSGWIIFSNILGIGLIFILSIVGSLNGVRQKNTHVFLMTIYGVFIWIIASIGSFIKMPLLLSSRLFVFFWTISVPFIAAIGISFIVTKFGKKGIISCCLVLFVITVVNLGNPLSGSETSFLLHDQPYIKLYDTNKDISTYFWLREYTPEKSSIKMSESWIAQNYDSRRHYRELPFTDQNIINISEIQTGDYVLLTTYSINGIRIRGTHESAQIRSIISKEKTTVDAYLSHSRIIKIQFVELQETISSLHQIYSNGDVYINNL